METRIGKISLCQIVSTSGPNFFTGATASITSDALIVIRYSKQKTSIRFQFTMRMKSRNQSGLNRTIIGASRRSFACSARACRAACGRSRQIPGSQAKAPAPQWTLKDLRAPVGQAFSLSDFCHGLLGSKLPGKGVQSSGYA